MKIYEKNLSDVLKKLPWQYKIVLLAGVVFLCVVFVHLFTKFFVKNIEINLAEPISLNSYERKKLNLLDPSIAYNPTTKEVWMAYTSLDLSREKNTTDIIFSKSISGKCKEWSQTSSGILGKSAEILAPDGTTVLSRGQWRIETPSLVYDPDDPGKEWKFYAYKYFWSDDPSYALSFAKHYGFIIYRYASHPDKEWSPEKWLFSPTEDYPPPPYTSLVQEHLNDLHPDLEDIVAYSRPSTFYQDGILVMLLSAFTTGATPDRLVMIVSHDHGKKWRYMGSPLNEADVKKMGNYTVLAGASLFENKGQFYLSAVLGDEKKIGQGSFLLDFKNFAKAELLRDKETGAPIVLKKIPLSTENTGRMGGGFSAYTKACPNMTFVAEQSAPEHRFQILNIPESPFEKE